MFCHRNPGISLSWDSRSNRPDQPLRPTSDFGVVGVISGKNSAADRDWNSRRDCQCVRLRMMLTISSKQSPFPSVSTIQHPPPTQLPRVHRWNCHTLIVMPQGSNPTIIPKSHESISSYLSTPKTSHPPDDPLTRRRRRPIFSPFVSTNPRKRYWSASRLGPHAAIPRPTQYSF